MVWFAAAPTQGLAHRFAIKRSGGVPRDSVVTSGCSVFRPKSGERSWTKGGGRSRERVHREKGGRGILRMRPLLTRGQLHPSAKPVHQ